MKRRDFFKGAAAAGTGIFVYGEGLKTGYHFPVNGADIVPKGTNPIDWSGLRKQFLLPVDYAYLNTGGLGSSPKPVLETVQKHMVKEEKKPSAGHDHDLWQQVMEKCAVLFSPRADADEIALVSTATEGINVIVRGLSLQKGDEVITSSHEHPALNVPLLYRAKRDGIVLKVFEPDNSSGLANVTAIKKLISNRTRLIFISHVTCTTGQRFPIEEIAHLASSRGIDFALDGAQAAAQFPLDVKSWGINFYTCSGHKWLLGPKRTGILYVDKKRIAGLEPLTVGAYSDDGFDIKKGHLALQATAQRYEYATQNDALFYGLGRALDYINAVDINNIWQHNRELAEQFYHGLLAIPGVENLSPAQVEYRTAIITFRIPGRAYQRVATALAEKGIRVRVVPENNLQGIRASFHLYNNSGEVDRTLRELRRMVV